MNLVGIASACAVECERQQADTVNDLRNLLAAYERVQMFGDEIFEDGAGFIRLAMDIEPMKNDGYGYRTTPVTFADGGSSANASDISRLMNNLVDAMNAADFFPTYDVVHEFLWIHPFADGNGRVAFLLQNYLDGTLDDPQPLRRHF